jgi:hypothetical protein
MSKDAIDATLAKAGTIATYSGAGTAGFGWLTVNEIAGVVGATAAVIGVVMQIYFGRQRNHREIDLHRAKMRHYERDEHEDAGV